MTSNLLLASLSPEILDHIQPHLRAVELSFGASIAEMGEPVELVYFPHEGMISFVVELLDGARIETAMVGREGVVNASGALSGGLSMGIAAVQLAGHASAIEAGRFAQLADKLPPLLSAVNLHTQVFLAQTQQTSACHAVHSAEARICRWLLQLRDNAQSNRFMLTQEFLAQMMGVQRASVSIVATGLKSKGLIHYTRGNIMIIDVDGLRRHACECYDAVKAHQAHLYGAGAGHGRPTASSGHHLSELG